MKIEIEADTKALVRQLDLFAADQMPFATALALTKTAQAARDQVRQELPERFTIRRPWVPRGVTIDPATKADLTAEVGSMDEFMIRQEEGGTKRPKRKMLAVPTDQLQRTKTGAISKANRPGKVLKQKKAFIITATSQAKRARPGTVMIARRKSKQRYPIEVLYSLTPRAEVPPRWEFENTVRGVVDEQLGPQFIKAMDRAVVTAKRSRH